MPDMWMKTETLDTSSTSKDLNGNVDADDLRPLSLPLLRLRPDIDHI